MVSRLYLRVDESGRVRLGRNELEVGVGSCSGEGPVVGWEVMEVRWMLYGVVGW